MPTVNLDTGDAVELAELLQFLHDWLATHDVGFPRFGGEGGAPRVLRR
jgi:hypothetical protein